ncbi:hypothetical protein [Streptomyces sp. NBC_00356]|uniref:hypothetical protein n=1 Tax=Streptomyces sp. NBC_00356 TaxID=2975724 RepID=UPI002E270DED
MIAFPRASVPIPDAVASFSAAQWTDQQRADVTAAGDACRRYASDGLSGPQYVEARWLLAQNLAAINKRLAAYNPRLVRDWNNMPERYERGPQ